MLKKILIATAISSAFAVPAMADVTVGGQIGYSVDYIDVNGGQSETSINDNRSRLSVTAKEDLGGGLKVRAVYELNANLDTTGTATTRNAFVALQSGKLTVALGDMNGEHGSINPMQNQREGVISRVDGNDGLTTLVGVEQTNRAVGASYALNANTKIDARYTFERDAITTSGLTDNRSVTEIAVTSEIMPGLTVGGAYSVGEAPAGTVGALDSGYQVVGSYVYGPVKVGGFYTETTLEAPGSETEVKSYALTSEYAVSPLTAVVAGFGNREVEGFADVDFYEIGARHNFSKRTSAYVKYADQDTQTVTSIGMGVRF